MCYNKGRYGFYTEGCNVNSICFARLNRLKSAGNSTQRRLASYFLNHIGDIKSLTITAVASETDTGYSTVCRFLKEIGVSGFKELKKSVADELDEQKRSENILSKSYLEFTPSDSFEVIAKRICNFSMDVTNNSYRAISNENAELIYRRFKNADQIHFFGLGTSAVSAQYAYIKLFRLKTGCSYGCDTVISKMTSSMLGKNDVLFLFSSSGRTKAVLEAAKIAKLRGATVVAISDFINTPLYHLADINICTTMRDINKYLDSDFPLIQGQVTIIDILYKYLYSKMKQSAEENQSITLSAISIDKQ